MQVKEGGTSLHKTFRGINLAFKGLKNLDVFEAKIPAGMALYCKNNQTRRYMYG